MQQLYLLAPNAQLFLDRIAHRGTKFHEHVFLQQRVLNMQNQTQHRKIQLVGQLVQTWHSWMQLKDRRERVEHVRHQLQNHLPQQ